MSKKIMLLALTVVSAALFALPAAASASEPLHLNPTPSEPVAIHGGAVSLSDTSGITTSCSEANGSATFDEGGTTGILILTIGPNCKESVFGSSCKSTGGSAGSIQTTALPFHLVTLPNEEPGFLITPSSDGSFAHIECAGGLIKYTWTGTGLIGTIENECGETSTEALIDFNAFAHGAQEHATVAGTETEFRMKKGENNVAVDTTMVATFGEQVELDCT